MSEADWTLIDADIEDLLVTCCSLTRRRSTNR